MKSELEDEFRAFAESAIPRLRRLASATCRDPHRADDLVQTTLEKMYAAWPRVHAVEEPHAYARTVLVRSLISEQRRHWWQRESSTADAGAELAAASRSTPWRTVSTCGPRSPISPTDSGWRWSCDISRTCPWPRWPG